MGMEAQYAVRINQVLDYMDSHINQPMELADFAEIANLSKFHFHRVFSETFGLSAVKYLQRLRLERSVKNLIYNPSFSIGEIADRCGFSTAGNFCRAFRNYFGLSARELRAMFDYRDIQNFHDIANRRLKGHLLAKRFDLSVFDGYRPKEICKDLGEEMYSTLHSFERLSFERRSSADLVYCRHFGPMDLGSVESRAFGLWFWVGSMAERFPDEHFFKVGMSPDRPEFTPAAYRRFDLGVLVANKVPHDCAFNRREVPGGLWAIFPVMAEPAKHRGIWRLLMSEWLPRVPWEQDDRQLMTLYSLKVDCNKEGKKEHLFCLPIRPAGQF
ncbi:MAG: AraC family transcriptional regulator [Spirochaetaceae bacterium]|nr:MAG: AraC family transcriptional regulator [Spirochaetaceae bacterium]